MLPIIQKIELNMKEEANNKKTSPKELAARSKNMEPSRV
jgi:hypothetical protein